jgi:anti-sigma28 factor (negative regulator of flagellin synthesis)
MATNLSVPVSVQAVQCEEVECHSPQHSALESVEVRKNVRERRLLVQQVRFDEQERNARLEEIKAQVNAETYQIDASAIASWMLETSQTRLVLGIGEQGQQKGQEK